MNTTTNPLRTRITTFALIAVAPAFGLAVVTAGAAHANRPAEFGFGTGCISAPASTVTPAPTSYALERQVVAAHAAAVHADLSR